MNAAGRDCCGVVEHIWKCADTYGVDPARIAVGGEFDGLRRQRELYAAQLERAGVPVRTVRYGGATRAIIDRLGRVPQSEDTVQEVADAIGAL